MTKPKPTQETIDSLIAVIIKQGEQLRAAGKKCA